MIRDYWVYQKRNVAVPWAIYIVKSYTRERSWESTQLAMTIYSEDIPNEDHCMAFVGLQSKTVSGYVDMIAEQLSGFTTFTEYDRQQLEEELLDIIAY